jgi:hypothetical protein
MSEKLRGSPILGLLTKLKSLGNNMTQRAQILENPLSELAQDCIGGTHPMRCGAGRMAILCDRRSVTVGVLNSHLRFLCTQKPSTEGRRLIKALFGSVMNLLPKNTGATVSMFHFNAGIAPVKAADDSGVFEPFPRSNNSVPSAALHIAQTYGMAARNALTAARKFLRPKVRVWYLPLLAA